MEHDLAQAYLAAIHADDASETARLEAQLDALDERERTRDLGRAALYYAHRWGWPVFPLVPGDKRPLTRHGFKDATTDPQQIKAWWAETPEANIGLPTGIRFDVLDVDWLTKDGRPTGAQQAWPTLRDSGVLPDIHGVAMTARGGQHIYLQPQGGGNEARKFGYGLDYRGIGGYVVAPPSRTATSRWAWTVNPSPLLTGVEPAESSSRDSRAA